MSSSIPLSHLGLDLPPSFFSVVITDLNYTFFRGCSSVWGLPWKTTWEFTSKASQNLDPNAQDLTADPSHSVRTNTPDQHHSPPLLAHWGLLRATVRIAASITSHMDVGRVWTARSSDLCSGLVVAPCYFILL